MNEMEWDGAHQICVAVSEQFGHERKAAPAVEAVGDFLKGHILWVDLGHFGRESVHWALTISMESVRCLLMASVKSCHIWSALSRR
jgi:hypothetical protein